MNRLEIIDVVRTNLLAQGEKSEADGKCLYRGPNGLKCGIGFLIPDDVYKPSMEDTLASELCKVYKELPQDIFHKNNRNFLDHLQALHDDNEPEYWPIAFEEFRIGYA